MTAVLTADAGTYKTGQLVRVLSTHKREGWVRICVEGEPSEIVPASAVRPIAMEPTRQESHATELFRA